MLPGKAYTSGEILRIATHRRWLLVIPVALGAAVAVGVSKHLPNKYRSETVITLVPQRIPDSYAKSAVSSRIEDRLATLREQILSRSRLERIILDLNLYQLDRRRLPMEDVVQRMRDDISIQTEGRESQSFQLSYVNSDATTAQKATERLASFFIEENLRDREKVAEDTNQFLDSQLQDARRRLVDQEKKLEEYRRRYSGELPTQASTNLQAMQNAQLQLQSLGEFSDRARERRLLAERQIAELQTQSPIATATQAARPQDSGVESTAQQLATARARRELLLTRAKPDHPDVRILQRAIRDLEVKQQAELKVSAGRDQQPADELVSPAEALRGKRIRDLTDQVGDLDRELLERQQREKHLLDVIANYQARLDVIPTRESELVELTRDYTTLQTTYQGLLTKGEESKLAADLERREIGEQFRVLDPARIPERPFGPKRPLIVLGGAGGGLVCGVLIIALLEYRDSTFSCEDEVVRLCQLPVLAQVPLMLSDEERRGRHERAVLVRITAAAVIVLISAGAIVVWSLRF